MADPKQYMVPGGGFVNETADVDKQYMMPGSGFLAESGTGGGGGAPPGGAAEPGLFFANG